MVKKLTLVVIMAAASAWASGLPEVYKPRAEPPVKPPEKEPKVEKPGGLMPGGELNDVRFLFAVGGVAEKDIPTATAKLVPVLERRAAYLAQRYEVERGPGGGRITVGLFGCPDPARALQILMAPGLLEFQAVAEREDFEKTIAEAGWPAEGLLSYEHGNVVLVAEEDREELAAALRAALPPGRRVVWTRRLDSKPGSVYKAALTTGDGMAITSVIDAAVVENPLTGGPEVHFDLGERDATIFSGLTARQLGKALAVVFDDELFYTARVKEQAFKSARITGELDEARARDIALMLSSGSLPATLTPVEYSVDGESRPIPQPTK